MNKQLSTLIISAVTLTLLASAALTTAALAAPLRAIVTAALDTTGNVGTHSSLVLDADSNPVISYRHQGDGNLKFIYCHDPVCSTSTMRTLDSSGSTGWFTSIKLNSQGNPVIAYTTTVTGPGLKLIVCSTPTCEPGSVTIRTLDNASNNYQSFTSLQLDDNDNPVISYSRTTAPVIGLWLAYCADPVCSSHQLTSVATGAIQSSSLQLDSAGNPVISYIHSGVSPPYLGLVRCSNPNCSGAKSDVEIEATSSQDGTSLALNASGNPVIAYRRTLTPGLALVTCGNPSCTNFEQNNVNSTTGLQMSLQLDSAGNPAISYHSGNTTQTIVLARCSTPTCEPGSATNTIVASTGFGIHKTSLALDCSGHPVISYYDAAAQNLTLAYEDTATKCAHFDGSPSAPGPLAFIAARGDSSQLTIDVINDGMTDTLLDVSLLSISDDYSIVSGLPITGLATTDPAETITVQCDSAPQAAGTLVLTTNDPANLTVTYDLTCLELEPEFSGSPAAPGPLVFVDGALQLDIEVSNTGVPGSLLDVNETSISSGYTVLSGLPVAALPEGDSATITLQCDSVPQAAGTLVLTTNDPANLTVTYDLTCKAPAPEQDGQGGRSTSKPIASSGVTTLQFGRLFVSLPASAIPPGQTGCEVVVKEQGSSGPHGFALDDTVWDVKVICNSGEVNIFLDALTICIRPQDGVAGNKTLYHRHTAAAGFQPLAGGSGPAGYVCGQTRVLSLFTLGQLSLPATGFAPGMVTEVGAPAVAYAASELILSIPKLGVEMDILGVPQGVNGWDVTWLGSDQAGYLYGTTFPTWRGNSVLTAHVWNADNTPGPFHGLKDLQHGDRFTISAYGYTYTYEVRSSRLVNESNLNVLTSNSQYSQITLITCETFSESSGGYLYRRAVQAVLVTVSN